MRKLMISSAAALALMAGPLVVAASAQSLGDAPNYTPPHAESAWSGNQVNSAPPQAYAHVAATGTYYPAANTMAIYGGAPPVPFVNHLGSESGASAKNTRNLPYGHDVTE